MLQQSAYQTWCTGILDSSVIEFWNELKLMNSMELSSLVPFFRLSSVLYEIGGNGEIKEILPYTQFDFLKTEFQSETKKGFYDIDNFDLEVSGDANSLYKGTISLKLFDLNLIEDVKLKKILSLGSNVKIDFGWNKWDWGESNYSSINQFSFHKGTGHTLFAIISGREISFNNENIMEISLNFTSSTYNIMNNKKLQNLVEINWDKIENVQNINTTSQGSFQWIRNFWGKTFSKKAIKLKDILRYLTDKINDEKKYNEIIPEFDTSIELDYQNLKNIRSIDPNIILDGNTVGDFFITTKLADRIYHTSKTYRKYINDLLQSINDAYKDDIKLKTVQTPKGNECVILDYGKDSSDLWSERDNYLKLDYGTKKSLTKDISFSSDLNESTKNLEIHINASQIQGATPDVLKTFALTWLYDEETWNNFSETEKDNIIKRLFKNEPDKLLNTLLETTDLTLLDKENQEKAIKDIKEIVKNKEIRDNSIRYLPYKMSATLFGISDIWTGTNIYLDENFIIPIFQNTIWQITNVKHQIDSGEWTVSIEASMLFRKKWDEFVNMISNRIKNLNL